MHNRIKIFNEFFQVGGYYRLQYQKGEWFLEHKTRSIEKENDTKLKEALKLNNSWYIMHKFQTIARDLQDFQPCCSKFERENPRLSKIPTCIIKSENGKMAKVISGTTFKTISFQENVDVETLSINMSDVELNRILIAEFEISLDTPINFNSIMQDLCNNWIDVIMVYGWYFVKCLFYIDQTDIDDKYKS